MSDVVFTFKEVTDPSPTEDFASGYPIGTQWTNIDTQVTFESVGDGVWQMESDLVSDTIHPLHTEIIPSNKQIIVSTQLEIQGVLDIQGTLDII
jgi:hypothetical protein